MSDTEPQASPELDARVAEKVMGWHLHTIADGSHRGVYWTRIPGPYAPCLWRADYKDLDEIPSDCARHTFCPSTDPAADYEVLKVAREWPEERREAFCQALLDIWGERREAAGWPSLGGILYQPGDYSRAALKAVEAA